MGFYLNKKVIIIIADTLYIQKLTPGKYGNHS